MNALFDTTNTGPVIRVVDVSKFYGSVPALQEVELHVNRGEFVALLGPNGAGKTTLLMLLGGYAAPDKGHIQVFGKPPRKLTPSEKNRWGFVFQDLPGLYPELTVREHLELYSAYYARPRDADKLIEALDLSRLCTRKTEDLSGGERKRLELALAFLGQPELIFLDEPTTGLDPQARQVMWNFLTDMKRDGVTFVMTTHYLNEVEALADRLLILHAGQLVFDGHPGDLKRAENVTTTEALSLEVAYVNLLEELNHANT